MIGALGGTENAKKKKTDEPVREYHPSLQHMYYFLGAPTLCYQESYPRSERIRKVTYLQNQTKPIPYINVLVCALLIAICASSFVGINLLYGITSVYRRTICITHCKKQHGSL
jgi:hypothetical protein